MILKIIFTRSFDLILKNHYKDFDFCANSVLTIDKKNNDYPVTRGYCVYGVTSLILITFLLICTMILEDHDVPIP